MTDQRRFPASVYREGEEPDPRFSLANERTFLAWVRTALALYAGAFALEALAIPEPMVWRASAAATVLFAILIVLTVIQVRYGHSRVNYA